MLKVFDIIKNLFVKWEFDLFCRDKRKNLPKNFKIIPLGKYCFPRVITTINKLKPKKKRGEKSCPFDLAFFYDFDEITKLIDTKFSNFYDDLIYNDKNQWVNDKVKAFLNHEGGFSKEQIIERYNKRIQNMFDYFANKSFYKFILIASFEEVSASQLESLEKALEKYMAQNEFSIILINQSEEYNSYIAKNIYVINQNHNVEKFNYMNRKSRWAIELRKRKTKEANDIYSEVTVELLNIIENSLINK